MEEHLKMSMLFIGHEMRWKMTSSPKEREDISLQMQKEMSINYFTLLMKQCLLLYSYNDPDKFLVCARERIFKAATK